MLIEKGRSRESREDCVQPIVITAVLKPKDGCGEQLIQALQKVRAALRVRFLTRKLAPFLGL